MPAEQLLTPHILRDKSHTQQCPATFKITSPLFYAQVARCTSISEYVKVALSKPNLGANTFHVSHPELFLKLFEGPPSAFSLFKMWPWWKAALVDQNPGLLDASHLAPVSLQKRFPWAPFHVNVNEASLVPNSLFNRLRWLLIHFFRRLPSPSQHSALSDLDACAVHLPSTDAPRVRAYRKAVLKMLLSDYVAFGMPAVVDAALWIVRIWLCWLCVQSFDGLVVLCNGHGHLTVTEVGKVVLGFLGVHLWRGLGDVL